jgi:hypothetical protein
VRLNPLRPLLIPVLALVAFAAWPDTAEAQAQRRAPARHRVVFRGGVYGPVFVQPSYGYGYGFGYPRYAFGYYDRVGYPYGPYGFYGRYDELNSSVRLEVNPKNAEVFVDGFRAGTVDDYDGFLQRLRVRPGQHEITLYLDGYRTERQSVYFNTHSDQKIRHTMVPLQAGDTQEPRPVAPAQPADAPANDAPPREQLAPASAFGAVSIRVQPADAEIFIDGERWTGPATQERLTVELARGRHRVEVRKEGYEMYTNDIDVRAGATATLNISLPRRQ